ncbi:MAG TPA: SAM-dependent methyltransferase [Dehalococcoidia bacterium]|nr:SAM-dependent methyltransferase [Dehalococcoidia bacterium]
MAHVRDEFEAITESAPLVDELRRRIAASGPITFREFMAAALYHERHGYYPARPQATSRGGDYVTSPEVHPVFGALVGRQLAEMWRALGSPPAFDVIEQGAGAGLLARDIIRRSLRQDPDFAAALRYHIVEPIPALRAAQQRTLEREPGAGAAVRWHDTLPRQITGCVLSNELVDAFPVHRVFRDGSGLHEVYVGVEDRRFVERLAPPSTPRITSYFDALGLLPGEGCYAEVNLEALDWMRDVAAALTRGFVLTFDYGYDAADLYAPWRRDGTLLCFHAQSASSDPFVRIGKQDITASVDFTSLRRAGEDAGLRTLAFTGQASFLVRLGIGEAVAAARDTHPDSMEEYFARRRVVMDLIDPGRLGRIKVLLQGKDAPPTPLTGFSGDA